MIGYYERDGEIKTGGALLNSPSQADAAARSACSARAEGCRDR